MNSRVIIRDGFAIEYPDTWTKQDLAVALKSWVDDHLPPEYEPLPVEPPVQPNGGPAVMEAVVNG
jgi:hypothetical protein